MNYELIYKRINLIKKFLYFCFFILIFFLIYIIVFRRSFYYSKYDAIVNKYYYYNSAPRGRIYDRNHKLLVDNKLVPVIYYIKDNQISSSDEIDIAYNLSKIIDVDLSKLTLREQKEFYLKLNKRDDLIFQNEWELLSYRKIDYNDIYELKIERLSDDLFNNSTKEFKKAAYIYYLMNNGYMSEIKEIKSKEVSDKELSNILNSIETLPGVFIDYTYERNYLYGDTFKSILGSISSIPIEEKNYYLSNGYNLTDMVGISYIEKQYEKYLHGEKGKYYVKDNNIIKLSDNIRGKDVILSIDIELQKKIDKILDEELIEAKNDPNTDLFNSIYVVIKDPKNGDILAMSGRGIRKVNGKYETYDLAIGTLTNSMTPGSVIKGASMLVGYKEKAIDIGTTFNDNCIKIYSFPKKCSWKTLGVVNDIKALSYSSNIYQFKTAFKVAKFDYSYNKKINDISSAFLSYRNLFNEMGLGSKSGIDLPVDGVGNIGRSISPDLYLNYVIGQYDGYTTMQLSEYISTIANFGERVNPHLLKEERNNDNGDDLGSLFFEYVPKKSEISVDKKYVSRVREGFRDVLISGLGKNFMGNVANPAGKTGTSETFYDSDGNGIIDTSTVSNAFVGYYPENNPKMSIAITFPNIMTLGNGNEYRSYANKRITKRIVELFDSMY